MDNFDLKKYLVENKVTTNSRIIKEETTTEWDTYEDYLEANPNMPIKWIQNEEPDWYEYEAEDEGYMGYWDLTGEDAQGGKYTAQFTAFVSNEGDEDNDEDDGWGDDEREPPFANVELSDGDITDVVKVS
jgi:hypothetical protein